MMKKMTIHVTGDTRQQDEIGMSTCSKIVQGRAGHGWQRFSPTNDNGVDAMIIMRKKKRDTGEFIFVQVKCGTPGGYYKETKKRPESFGVLVKEKYIKEKRPKWRNYPFPVILVFVDFETEKAWWVDVKDQRAYTPENKNIILVPKNQRFERHCFGELRKLPGALHPSPEIQEIDMSNEELSYLNLTNKSGIKEQAKKFFQEWARSTAFGRKNPSLGEVIVSRVGWRHMIRNGRNQTRIFQSFQLLSTAQRIITEISRCYQVRQSEKKILPNGQTLIIDYLSLRASVRFPHRQSAVVQVILKRKRWIHEDGSAESKIWFFSVYEPLRKIKMH